MNVDDDTARQLGVGWVKESSGAGKTEAEGYEAQTVEELKAEITSRNEGRDDADHIPVSGKKADLIAALEADDNK